MNYFLLSAGIIVLIITLIDIAWTALSLEGAGFITGRVSRWVWRLFLWLSKKNGRSKILSLVGILNIGMIMAAWILLIWTGNVLIFLSSNTNLIDAANIPQNELSDKIYFVGYTLSTMGSGDLIPSGDGWQIYTAFASFSGLIIITVVITYIVPVLDSVASERAIANSISMMGTNIISLVKNAWDGNSFQQVESFFQSTTSQLLIHIQHHKAYPILSYFHTAKPSSSLPIYLAVLDEAISILIHCAPDDKKPSPRSILPLRKTIDLYLDTIDQEFLREIDSLKQDEGLPDLSVYEEELKEILPKIGKMGMNNPELIQRRRILGGFLRFNGWTWDDIIYTQEKRANFINYENL